MTVRPDEIESRPKDAFVLDDVLFVPQQGDCELAYRDGWPLGEIGIDEIYNTWRARKGDGDWRPMRCLAEARAFLVSRVRT